MSLLEGGAFRCDTHHFTTTKVDEWNEHCEEYPDIHTEQGTTACFKCGTIIEFSNLPFHPVGADGSKGIMLACDECEAKTTGSVQKRTLTR